MAGLAVWMLIGLMVLVVSVIMEVISEGTGNTKSQKQDAERPKHVILWLILTTILWPVLLLVIILAIIENVPPSEFFSRRKSEKPAWDAVKDGKQRWVVSHHQSMVVWSLTISVPDDVVTHVVVVPVSQATRVAVATRVNELTDPALPLKFLDNTEKGIESLRLACMNDTDWIGSFAPGMSSKKRELWERHKKWWAMTEKSLYGDSEKGPNS